KIQLGDIAGMTPDERETVSAFTTRFAAYQEQIGKTMRSIAIEEESATTPFGAILALMEKLGILDSGEKWKELRELRNLVSHEYEDDPDELFQALNKLVENAPYLTAIHERIQDFVTQAYPAAS
ncbi:HepT-like ribonuclease domain-containing protein, partial [Aromatoleum aromaticum]|uniref:HepT-like ribonuclease domain-containing protein n=2 Tax=Aromatoleum aromaticum TaxID=551760 RepID=UPI0014598C3A